MRTLYYLAGTALLLAAGDLLARVFMILISVGG